MLELPLIGQAFKLRGDAEGVAGRVLEHELSGAEREALAVVEDAVAWREEETEKQRKRDEQRGRK